MSTYLPITFPIGTQPHFLDSGAFSLFSRNRTNPKFFRSKAFKAYLNEYVVFVKKHATAIDVYANVDVIKDPEYTYKVQKHLERKGLNPLPVVHYGDDLKWLKRYLSEGYPYIALGGIPAGKIHFKTQKKMREWYWNWADAAFKLICDTPNHLPKCKVHGFGVTQFRNMVRYPWYSVDSTAWVIKAAYGQIMVPPKINKEYVFAPPVTQTSYKPYQYRLFFVGSDSPYIKRSSDSDKPQKHVMNCPPGTDQRQQVLDWLEEIGVPFGCSEVLIDGRVVDCSVRLVDEKRWKTFGVPDKFIINEERKEIRVVEEGVSNNMIQRTAANIRYYQRLVQSLPAWPWPWTGEVHKRRPPITSKKEKSR